jgi:hypothetical protein
MNLFSKTPYLSLVVTSRNDDDESLHRMQIFVSNWVSQVQRYRLRCELIIVEWNYLSDRPRLIQALEWPQNNDWCTIRIIGVSPEIHNGFENSDVIPLFQMIAKNVGIRRAHGSFVLATNVDILFSNELVEFLASKNLRENLMYRIDRYDIPADVPINLPIDQQMHWCEQNVLRLYRRLETIEIKNGVLSQKTKRRQNLLKSVKDLIWHTDLLLHTNACGDFTLLSKRYWETVMGYPEFPTRAMKLDGLLCYAAHYAGAKEYVLRAPMRIYHLEHPARTDGALIALSKRQEDRASLQVSLSQYQAWTEQMRRLRIPIILNKVGWGLTDMDLNETIIE